MKFNFQLEYQKEQDNTVADMLSRITTVLPWRPLNLSWMEQPSVPPRGQKEKTLPWLKVTRRKKRKYKSLLDKP